MNPYAWPIDQNLFESDVRRMVSKINEKAAFEKVRVTSNQTAGSWNWVVRAALDKPAQEFMMSDAGTWAGLISIGEYYGLW